jgi:hypothetical protein
MKVRILIPGRKPDDVASRCEKCGAEVTRSVPRAGELLSTLARLDKIAPVHSKGAPVSEQGSKYWMAPVRVTGAIALP